MTTPATTTTEGFTEEDEVSFEQHVPGRLVCCAPMGMEREAVLARAKHENPKYSFSIIGNQERCTNGHMDRKHFHLRVK